MGGMTATRIVGGNPGNGRRKGDYYPTPPDVTTALLDFLKIPQGATVWECACGDGQMARAIEAKGYQVISSDIADLGFGQAGVNFLEDQGPEKYDWIITNPPFSEAERFIRRAWESGRPFAFLLKSHFWNAGKRVQLFEECRPSYVLPLSWRPDFTGGGNSLMDMIWTVWERRPTLGVEYHILRRPKERG